MSNNIFINNLYANSITFGSISLNNATTTTSGLGLENVMSINSTIGNFNVSSFNSRNGFVNNNFINNTITGLLAVSGTTRATNKTITNMSVTNITTSNLGVVNSTDYGFIVASNSSQAIVGTIGNTLKYWNVTAGGIAAISGGITYNTGGYYTVTRPGVYDVTVNAFYGPTSDMDIWIYINNQSNRFAEINAGSNTTGSSLQVSALVLCQANDQIYAGVYSATSCNIQSNYSTRVYPFFSIKKVF